MLQVAERPHGACRVHAVSKNSGFRLLDKQRCRGLGEVTFHQNPAYAGAALATRLESSAIDLGHRMIEIITIIQDGRVLAAKLKLRRDQIVRCRTPDKATSGHRPGEADTVNILGGDQLTGLPPANHRHLHQTIGEKFLRDLAQDVVRRRGELAWLENHRIAKGDGRAHLAKRCHRRKIPGRDAENCAAWPAQDLVGEMRPAIGNWRGAHASRLTNHEAPFGRPFHRLALRLGKDLPLFKGDGFGNAVCICHHGVKEGVKPRTALKPRHLGPCGLRGVRPFYDSGDLGFTGPAIAPDVFLRTRRINRLKGGAIAIGKIIFQ